MLRAKLLLPVILAVALVSTACVGFSEPRGWASPVFNTDGDTVYVFVDSEEFAAVDLDEFGGEARWVFPDEDIEVEDEIDLEAVYGPPLFAGDRIILAGFTGEIVSLTSQGRFVSGLSWRRDDVRGTIVGGATLVEREAGDRFAFGTTEELLYMRRVEDGGTAAPWPVEGLRLQGEIWSQPVVVGDVLYVGTMDGNLYALDVESGEELWREPFDAGGAIADLAFIEGEGLLFVPTLGGEVWLVDAESGRARREAFQTEGWVWTKPAVEGGVAYFGGFDGLVHALDLGTGRSRWTYDAEDKVKARGVIIGDTFIVADEGGTVHFVDLATGMRRNAVKLDRAGKIRADLVEKEGFVWIIGTEGRLYRATAAELDGQPKLTVVEREVRGLP